jgi:hypothetical protein
MFNHYANHPLSSVPGVLALAVWSIYLLYAALCYPDVLSSVLISAFSACSPAWLQCSILDIGAQRFYWLHRFIYCSI